MLDCVEPRAFCQAAATNISCTFHFPLSGARMELDPVRRRRRRRRREGGRRKRRRVRPCEVDPQTNPLFKGGQSAVFGFQRLSVRSGKRRENEQAMAIVSLSPHRTKG